MKQTIYETDKISDFLSENFPNVVVKIFNIFEYACFRDETTKTEKWFLIRQNHV